MPARRKRTVVVALGLALALAGCGNKQAHPTVADANNNGAYVDAGPVTYQLQVSRELNQYSPEDSAYLRGLPPGTQPNLGQTGFWYGVFLWAKNQTSVPQTTTDNFEIVDTQGTVYRPVRLNPAENEFVWTSQKLAPGAVQPGPNTVASEGPTQGGLLLFDLNNDVYANRPLTLFILDAAGRQLASISLDL